MSGSNIFMQLVTGAGPVVGEGLLQGWEGSIELREFSWGMHALKDPAPKTAAALARQAANAARSMAGLGNTVTMKMEPLRFVKRFDAASAQMHLCLDNHLPVLSASITVLHIKQAGRVIHQPGFVLVATKGYFQQVDVELQPDGNSMELMETYILNFQHIKMMYLMSVGKDQLPTAPFFHPPSLI
jgi:type VI protein secretion system component Hcp